MLSLAFYSMVFFTGYVLITPKYIVPAAPLLDSGCFQMFCGHFRLIVCTAELSIFLPKHVLP